MCKISIIVPIYNVENYLYRCIYSVRNQSFIDFDFILVDDGATDNSGLYSDRYALSDDRAIVIHQKNGGLSSARNTGIDWALICSSSEWVSFIDSDDWIHKNYLEILYNISICNECELSTCNVFFTKGKDFEENISLSKTDVLSPEEFYCKDTFLSISACEKLIKKHLIEANRFPNGLLHEDVFFTYKLVFKANKIAVSRNELYAYYGAPNSIMRRNWSPKRLIVFEGLQEQLSFYQKNGLSRASKRCILLIAETYCDQISQIEKEISNNVLDNLSFIHLLRQKLKMHIRKYRKYAGITIKKYPYFYTIAYPSFSKLFWAIDAQINKFR